MKRIVILFTTCLLSLTCTTGTVYSKSFGSRSSFHSSRSSSRSSFSKSSSFKSSSTRYSSRNSSRISNSNRRGLRSFSRSSTPRSIKKYQGRTFAKSKTIKTSSKSRRPVSFNYTRPIIFINPYMHHHTMQNSAAAVDTNAFPGFGKGKSGGAGASSHYSDSLKKQSSKDTVDVTELIPINYLSDYSNIIRDDLEPKINSLIRNYKKRTGVEIAVLTIPTLGDEIEMEEFAQYLFDKWGVGEQGANNGILIIISSEDEILRIQPGYGLEGLLPDAICRRIEDGIMVPACLKKQYDLSITNSVRDIIKTLGNEPVEIMKVELEKRKVREHQEFMSNLYTFFEVLGVIVVIILIIYLIRSRKKNKSDDDYDGWDRPKHKKHHKKH